MTMPRLESVARAATLGVTDRRDHAREERRLWGALVVLGTALYANQYVTLGKLKTLLLSRAPADPVATLGQKAWQVLLDSWHVLLTPADVAITAALLLSAGYVVWAEATQGTCTAVLRRAEGSRRVMIGLLGLASVIITRCYLAPGQVFMGDAETHMLRSWMFVEHFRNLDTPVWSNAWYGGFPLLANYGPLYFIVTALLTLVVGNIHLATKLLLWSCHVGSILAMFFFLREATRRDLAAFVGALAYALTFHRLHIILYQGDLQLSVVFLLYPLLLLIAERFIRTRQHAKRTFVGMALIEAALVLNHHGYAFFGLVFLGIYLAARLAVTPGSAWNRFKVLVFFGWTEVAALAMSAFLVVPFLLDMNEYRGLNGGSPFGILIPNLWGPIMLAKLFRWKAIGDGGSIGYLGVSIGVLALVGGWHAARRRHPPVVGLIAAAIASLVMVRNYGQYNIKNIDFFMIFACALAGWALLAVDDPAVRVGILTRARDRWRGHFPARATVVMAALLIVDLGPTTFQSVYRENYEFKQPMYARVLGLDGPYKVIERQVLTYDPRQPPGASFDPHKFGIPSAYAPIETPLGFFHEGAGLSFGYTMEMVKQLQRDLNAGRVSDDAAVALYLMGAKYVIFRDRYQWFSPDLEPSPLITMSNGVLQTTHATPLLASTRVIALADVAGYPATDLIRERRYLDRDAFDYSEDVFRQLVLPLIDRMNVHMDRGTADVLIARDETRRLDLGDPGRLEFSVDEFSTDLKRVRVGYRSNVDSVGRLPFNYFPYLDVEVDGRRVDFDRSAMNEILLRLPAGAHVVTVRGTAPPMQASMLWASLAALLGVLAVPRATFHGLEGEPSRG